MVVLVVLAGIALAIAVPKSDGKVFVYAEPDPASKVVCRIAADELDLGLRSKSFLRGGLRE